VELATARRPAGVVAAGRWFDEGALERFAVVLESGGIETRDEYLRCGGR
jgi:hypothetical protein